jgi:hypothetical protein
VFYDQFVEDARRVACAPGSNRARVSEAELLAIRRQASSLTETYFDTHRNTYGPAILRTKLWAAWVEYRLGDRGLSAESYGDMVADDMMMYHEQLYLEGKLDCEDRDQELAESLGPYLPWYLQAGGVVTKASVLGILRAGYDRATFYFNHGVGWESTHRQSCGDLSGKRFGNVRAKIGVSTPNTSAISSIPTWRNTG